MKTTKAKLARTTFICLCVGIVADPESEVKVCTTIAVSEHARDRALKKVDEILKTELATYEMSSGTFKVNWGKVKIITLTQKPLIIQYFGSDNMKEAFPE